MPDVEDEGDTEEREDMIHETMFTFEAFELVRDCARGRRTARTDTIVADDRNSHTPRLHGHCCSTSHATRSSTPQS